MTQLIVGIGLVFVVVTIIVVMVWFGWRRGTAQYELRPISGFEAMEGQLGRGVETGHPAHISIGVGGISGSDTLITLAGAAVVESLAEEAAQSGSSPVVSVADGTAMVLAQDMLRRPYAQRGEVGVYNPLYVQTMGMSPIQYVAGAMDYLSNSKPVSNTMIGVFGAEAALLAEAGARGGLSQVAGAADARALAVLHPSVDHLIVGEEIFAAAAYLDQKPGHIARLQAQDLARAVLVIVILAGAILSLLVG
jgi:hypothetical protein